MNSITHSGPTRPHTVEEQVQYFESTFGNLVDKACGEVKGKVEPHILLSRVTCLPVSARTQHRSFIKTNLTNIPPPVTFENIWSILNLYWDFLNYGLLEHVINKCGSEELKQKMQEYVDKLSTFKQTTRLCDFIESWPCRDDGPPEDRLKKVVVKMKHEWSQCTLQDVESFKKALVHKFFLPEFDIILQNVERGCVCVTWLTSPSIATLLQQNLANIETEFFKKHGINAVTIEPQESEKPSVGTLPEKLHSFKPSTSEVKTLMKETHRMRLAEEIVSEMSTSTVPSEKIQVDTHPADTQQAPPSHLKEKLLTLPHTAPSKYLTTLQQTPYTPEMSPGWLETSTPTGMYSVPKFSTYLGGTKPKSSYPSSEDWLDPPVQYDPPTPAEMYVREKRVDEISGRVTLPSLEQYLSKAEVEADPSLLTKYKDYLSSTPAIRAALYTTFNAKMAAEVFTWSQHTQSAPPTTMTELCTAFTLKTLVDLLSTQQVHQKQQLKVTTFSDLPTDVYKQFQDLCRMAYEGILNRQQLVFSAADLPTGFASLGLMQEVPQLYTEGRASSYHFIHLTLQEYLAAVHISQLPAHEQTRLFQKHVHSGHFKMTMRFLAGRTKLANIPPDITMDTKLNYFHFLFEAKDISMTTRILGSDEILVESDYSWTPLDYYVAGHAISHSNCPWSLDFIGYSIDDEKFELFCQGCAAPGGTGCRGHISDAQFIYNDLTSKSIQSFVNIPSHILQDMRELELGHNKLDGSACDLLAKAVPSMSRLEVLLLTGNPIGSGGAVEVIKALCGSGVKRLLLWNTGIGEPDCEALCELLKSSHSLQRLGQNNLSSECVASIITGLSHNSSLTHLVISDSHFSMANVDSLASVLKDHSKCTLTVLYLEDCHISSEGAVELAAALCKNTTIEDLNLDRNPIGEHVEGATAVAKILVENKALTELDLRDCHISSEGAVELAAALCKNTTLKHLDLSRNPIGEHVEGATAVAKMLLENKALTKLDLRDCHISSEGAVELAAALCTNTTIEDLDLSHNPIGEHVEGATAVAKILVENKALTELDLQDCHISSEGAVELAAALCTNTTIEDLDLSHNPIGEHVEGATAVAKILVENKALTELDLRDCHISSEGAVELAAALCKNTTLKHLDLSRNPIGEHVEGTTAVAKMLLENKALTKLDLRNCHISSEGAVELAAALCKNSTLKYLNLDHNPIGVEGASSMSDMLQHNTSLEELTLCDDSVGEEGVHQLINSLKHNQTLRTLYLPVKYKSETSDRRIRWL